MATTIITKYGSGAPTASDVVRGELAVDTENKRLYTEDSGGSVVELGTNPTTLAVDTDTLVVDATNNRVGIGLTSPDTKLHLSDGGTPEFRLESTDTSVVSGQSLGDITWESNDVSGGGQGVRAKIHAEAENAGTIYGLVFSTGTGAAPTEKVRITNTGNVGIGNDSPGVKLEVSNGSDSDLVMMIRGADNTTEYMALGVNGSNGVLTAGASGSESTNMVFRTASSGTEAEAMRIDSSGSVGIGGITPTGLLTLGTGTFSAAAANTSALYTSTTAGLVAVADGLLLVDRAGADVFKVDTSGNVGIGTSSPNYVLNTNYNANATFSNAASDFTQMWQNSDVNGLGVALADDLTARLVTNNGYELAFNNGTTEVMRIDTSGNVGIGTEATTLEEALTVHRSGSTSSFLQFTNGNTGQANNNGLYVGVNTSGTAYIGLRDTNDRDLLFQTNNSEAMRIDSSGRLLINTTSETTPGNNSAYLIVESDAGSSQEGIYIRSDGGIGDPAFVVGDASNVAQLNIFGDGDVENTNGTYGTISDARVKENITDAASQWEDFKAIRIRRYNLISKPNEPHIGVIAQELEEAGIGGLVKDTRQDGMKSVKTSILYMKAIKALQEAMERIETLEAKVAQLEGAN